MIRIINRDELQDMIKIPDSNVKIVDVLPEDRFQQEHIKGAISLPVGKIDKYAGQRLNQDDHIIVYCANRQCQASPKAAQMLAAKGFKNIYDYEDGLADWKAAGLPVEGRTVPVSQ